MTTSQGIDYGVGTTNVDHGTGRIGVPPIRFGVIPAKDLAGWFWHEESEPVYGCDDCEHNKEEEDGCDLVCEPREFILDDGTYKASQSAGSYASSDDVFILKSPYYTYAKFCSPCAPGACDLRSPLTFSDHVERVLKGVVEEPVRSYCFGPDCFDDDQPCPYPVYRVSDDMQID